MKQIIVLFFTLSLSLFGMSYTQFKNHTLKHSKVLQSQQLSLQVTEQQNQISTRIENPRLNLELGKYNPDFSASEYGYSLSASQSLPTQNYKSGLANKAYASTLLSQAYIAQGKAGYIKTLEKLYTQYVYESKLLMLLQQEYKLSQKVSSMVKAHYENGSESKIAYLQAKTETLMLKTQMHTTKEQVETLYYQLLAIAGFSKKVSLDKKFIYSISASTSSTSKLNASQKIALAKEKLYESQIVMSQSSFTHYELFAGIEQELDQSILRLGISIPLTLWHNKEEEKSVAILKMQQLKLDHAQLFLNLRSQKNILKSSIKELSSQYHWLKVLQKEQQSLNTLLAEGYQIAQGSLFELMSAKNKLIQTSKTLLQTQKKINHQKIELRFLQGYYND